MTITMKHFLCGGGEKNIVLVDGHEVIIYHSNDHWQAQLKGCFGQDSSLCGEWRSLDESDLLEYESGCPHYAGKAVVSEKWVRDVAAKLVESCREKAAAKKNII